MPLHVWIKRLKNSLLTGRAGVNKIRKRIRYV